MIAYVYDINTNRVLAEIVGATNEDCEAQYRDANWDAREDVAMSYTPAFGAVGGLIA